MPAILALFVRSIRELLRSRMSYAVLAGTVGVIFLFLLGAHAGATATTAPGLRFFQNSIAVELVFVTLAALSYFATAITEEKEEGTLGLLRMTDLDPLAILLGKSTSRLAAALLLLAATLPFTLLAITLGGISARQVFACYLCIGAYVVLLANVALLASVLSPRGAISTVATSMVVLGTPTIAAVLGNAGGWIANLPMGARLNFLVPGFTRAGELLQTLNPFRRIGAVLTTGFDGAIVDAQFWSSLGVAAACLLLAWLLFDLATGDQPGWIAPRLVPRQGSRWGRYAPGRAWLISALAWKDYHFLYGGRLGTVARWIGYGVLVAIVALPRAASGADFQSVTRSAFWVVSWVFALDLAVIGSRIVRTELREQTLVGLAGLPLSMQHVMLMKLDGARRALVPGIAWVAICAAVLFSSAVSSTLRSTPAAAGGDLIAIAGMAIAWAYLASQAWLLVHLAAYFSLRLKWGALPVALAIILLANLVGAMFCIGIFVMPILALTYVPQLRRTIYQRLERLAGED